VILLFLFNLELCFRDKKFIWRTG